MADIDRPPPLPETDDTVEMARACAHRHMLAVAPTVPTDYVDYGGTIERWEDPEKGYPDCSCGCRHAIWLDGDWLVCGKLGGPRQGLLTFEHQTGSECFEMADVEDGEDLKQDVETIGHLDMRMDGKLVG